MTAWYLRPRLQMGVLGLLVIGAVLFCLSKGDCALLTPDQRGYQLFSDAEYAEAAARFADPMWQATAWYRQGEFDKAASLYAGFDTPDAAFNQANALALQGKYEPAMERYQRALALRPGWEDAQINLEIAKSRAAMLKQEGGDMTGGKLGADEIVFDKGKSSPEAGEEQVDGNQEVSDAELRSIWLRQVQTRPADFLRAKFAYQHANQDKKEK